MPFAFYIRYTAVVLNNSLAIAGVLFFKLISYQVLGAKTKTEEGIITECTVVIRISDL